LFSQLKEDCLETKSRPPGFPLIGAGAIFASVTKTEFEAQEMLTPTPALAKAYEEVSRPIDEQLRVLFLQTQKLRAARDLLLPRLMSGEIAV